jgi:uridine kinase
MGICGGDCAGKKEMIHYMFKNEKGDWAIRESGEPVAILHQGYFIDPSRGNKYTSAGTNWELFYKQALSLLIGNEIEINYQRNGEDLKVSIKPAKLLIIEGSHIFMNNEITKNLSTLINLKVFIDSDSDIRLSRRVYQDTIDNKRDLNWSINNYLEHIKPSYDREIEPTKQSSDIIIPHFGGGFNDHKKESTSLFK